MRLPRQRRQQRGFTILELLVVLLIIGIVVSMATLAVGGNEARVLKDEAQRLTSLLDLAAQDAVLNNREMALELDQDSYQFLAYIEEEWLPLAEVDEFRLRELPPGIKLTSEVEGRLAAEDRFGTTEASRVWIMSSGEVSPFTITLALEQGPYYQLSGDMMGSLKLEGPLQK